MGKKEGDESSVSIHLSSCTAPPQVNEKGLSSNAARGGKKRGGHKGVAGGGRYLTARKSVAMVASLLRGRALIGLHQHLSMHALARSDPHSLSTCAQNLPHLPSGPRKRKGRWTPKCLSAYWLQQWARQGSNLQPTDYESAALPLSYGPGSGFIITTSTFLSSFSSLFDYAVSTPVNTLPGTYERSYDGRARPP